MFRKNNEEVDGLKHQKVPAHLSAGAPVTSAEEWFLKTGHKEWPLQLASEGELDLSCVVAGKLKTNEEIFEDLKTHASLEISILDDLLENIVGLEKNLNKYADHVLVVQHGKDGDDDGHEENLTTDDAGLDTCDTISTSSWKRGKQDAFISSRQRTIEHASFPGFDPNQLMPLPGSLEAPQLLNMITNIQRFHGTFKKIWKKYFLSEAAVAIFQDTFWWWFLERFQSQPESQACLFNRIAESFVGLFLSISSQDKDKFFQKYADCLAQAVYAAFCESFPMSFKSFDDEFRSDLLNIVSEWTTGVRPPPNSCASWDLNLLENDQMKALQEDRTNQLKSSLSFDPDTFLRIDQPEVQLDAQATNPSNTRLLQPTTESHQAGPGPDFERALFNLQGKSPLISQFLIANRLQFDEPAAVKKNITRTEISKLPPPFATYQELIQERKCDAKLANRRYMALLGERETGKERNGKSFRRIEEELKSKQSDVKMLSKKVINMMTKKDGELQTEDSFKDSSFTYEVSDDES